MSLLESTLLAAVFLVPGFISLALALSPRSRAIRQSSLGTRAFGLIFFALADWFLALLLYDCLPSDGSHCADLATLLVGDDSAPRPEILTRMLRLPASVLGAMGWLAAAALATGGISALMHHALLTGLAIKTFGLDSLKLRRLHKAWYYFARGTERTLRFLRLADLFEPLGAGQWLVLQKAAALLQRSSDGGLDAGGRVARVYVDVIQGDESVKSGKIGVLYTGTVKHLVCETDGNVVFLLLTEAKRWSQKRGTQGKWKPIENSQALGLDGRNIRNISFRLIEKNELPISWPKEPGAGGTPPGSLPP